MSMLKFDLERRPDLQLESSDYRAHYQDVVNRTLVLIGRRRRLIGSFVAVALALACITLPLMPRKYSATALVLPNLFSLEQGKVTPLASVDAASMVYSEAQLITSDTVLHAVVDRLKLDRTPDAVARANSWIFRSVDWFRGIFLPETRNHSPKDRAVAMLRNKLEVMKDSRSYLISISFTASSADEAAQIVNTVALEYLRDKSLQQSRDAVKAAEGELGRQLAMYGEKHPKVSQAADALDAARAAVDFAVRPSSNDLEVAAAGQGVKLAIPNWTPTSPKGFVILGLALLAGLLAGVGLIIWSDRRGQEPQELLLLALPYALRKRYFEKRPKGGRGGRRKGRRGGRGGRRAPRSKGSVPGARFSFDGLLSQQLRDGIASLSRRVTNIVPFLVQRGGSMGQLPGPQSGSILVAREDQPGQFGGSDTNVAHSQRLGVALGTLLERARAFFQTQRLRKADTGLDPVRQSEAALICQPEQPDLADVKEINVPPARGQGQESPTRKNEIEREVSPPERERSPQSASNGGQGQSQTIP